MSPRLARRLPRGFPLQPAGRYLVSPQTKITSPSLSSLLSSWSSSSRAPDEMEGVEKKQLGPGREAARTSLASERGHVATSRHPYVNERNCTYSDGDSVFVFAAGRLRCLCLLPRALAKRFSLLG
ncbi:hypothetical protein C8R45DRAFT_1091137 [Mycena sanguinolenta]|nr:hypothetical protein C8R45DRAFT_1091137 [Mycena sanguinolenta]